MDTSAADTMNPGPPVVGSPAHRALIRDFRRRLFDLHKRCGSPDQAAMRAAAPGLKRGTLSELLCDRRRTALPTAPVVTAFVTACLRCAGRPEQEIEQQVHALLQLRSAVEIGRSEPEPTAARTGIDIPVIPTTTVDTGPPDAEIRDRGAPAPTGNPPRRRPGRLWLMRFAVVLAAFGAGAATAVYTMPLLSSTLDPRPSSSPDPVILLDYDTCAESIRPSTRIGSGELAAASGPPGKPVHDRRVELRVQKHPEHGWIAWARLAKSPSDLDVLWLDWGYTPNPVNASAWRQCGAEVTVPRPDSPAILINDERGRPRWFRACGQADRKDRSPQHAGNFCTGWKRP